MSSEIYNTAPSSLPWRVRPYDLSKEPTVTVAPDGTAWAGQSWAIVSVDSEREVCSVGFRTANCAWSPVPNMHVAIANRDLIIRAVNEHANMLEIVQELARLCPTDRLDIGVLQEKAREVLERLNPEEHT